MSKTRCNTCLDYKWDDFMVWIDGEPICPSCISSDEYTKCDSCCESMRIEEGKTQCEPCEKEANKLKGNQP